MFLQLLLLKYMKYKITEEIVQKILNYFGKQPYVEVFQLIEELKKIEPISKKKSIKENK